MKEPPSFADVRFTSIGKPPSLLGRLQMEGEPSYTDESLPSASPPPEQQDSANESSDRPTLISRLAPSSIGPEPLLMNSTLDTPGSRPPPLQLPEQPSSSIAVSLMTALGYPLTPPTEPRTIPRTQASNQSSVAHLSTLISLKDQLRALASSFPSPDPSLGINSAYSSKEQSALALNKARLAHSLSKQCLAAAHAAETAASESLQAAERASSLADQSISSTDALAAALQSCRPPAALLALADQLSDWISTEESNQLATRREPANPFRLRIEPPIKIESTDGTLPKLSSHARPSTQPFATISDAEADELRRIEAEMHTIEEEARKRRVEEDLAMETEQRRLAEAAQLLKERQELARRRRVEEERRLQAQKEDADRRKREWFARKQAADAAEAEAAKRRETEEQRRANAEQLRRNKEDEKKAKKERESNIKEENDRKIKDVNERKAKEEHKKNAREEREWKAKVAAVEGQREAEARSAVQARATSERAEMQAQARAQQTLPKKPLPPLDLPKETARNGVQAISQPSQKPPSLPADFGGIPPSNPIDMTSPSATLVKSTQLGLRVLPPSTYHYPENTPITSRPSQAPASSRLSVPPISHFDEQEQLASSPESDHFLTFSTRGNEGNVTMNIAPPVEPDVQQVNIRHVSPVKPKAEPSSTTRLTGNGAALRLALATPPARAPHSERKESMPSSATLVLTPNTGFSNASVATERNFTSSQQTQTRSHPVRPTDSHNGIKPQLPKKARKANREAASTASSGPRVLPASLTAKSSAIVPQRSAAVTTKSSALTASNQDEKRRPSSTPEGDGGWDKFNHAVSTIPPIPPPVSRRGDHYSPPPRSVHNSSSRGGHWSPRNDLRSLPHERSVSPQRVIYERPPSPAAGHKRRRHDDDQGVDPELVPRTTRRRSASPTPHSRYRDAPASQRGPSPALLGRLGAAKNPSPASRNRPGKNQASKNGGIKRTGGDVSLLNRMSDVAL